METDGEGSGLPPLVKTRSREYWEDVPHDIMALFRYIEDCPIGELRKKAIERLGFMEIESDYWAGRTEQLHHRFMENDEKQFADYVLKAYIAGARSGAVGRAIEFVLTVKGRMDVDNFCREICGKILHDWPYPNAAIQQCMPSLQPYLERHLLYLDSCLRENYPDHINKYGDSSWVNFRRALKVVVHLAMESALPILQKQHKLMKQGLLVPSELIDSEGDAEFLLEAHKLRLRFAIKRLKERVATFRQDKAEWEAEAEEAAAAAIAATTT